MSLNRYGPVLRSVSDHSSRSCFWKLLLFGLLMLFPGFCGGVTMQQFIQSLDMMRNGCIAKHKVPLEILDRIRVGDFNLEPSQDLLCYTKCIAQLGGVLTKKGEFSITKALAQVPIILPPEMQTPARTALTHCKEEQNNHKDTCAKIYYMTKCVADFDPPNFKFP